MGELDQDWTEFADAYQLEFSEPNPSDIFQIYSARVASLPEFDRSATTELGTRVAVGREASSLILRAYLEEDPAAGDQSTDHGGGHSGIETEARDNLVIGHLAKVLSLAREYLPVDSPALPDLVQRGNLALVHGVTHHHWTERNYFVTPSPSAQIRRGIEKALFESDYSFTVDSATQVEIIRFQRAESSLEDLGIEPTDEALAEKLSWGVDLVRSIRQTRSEIMTSSLDDTTDSNEFETLGDEVANQYPDRDQIPTKSTESQRLMKLFNSITDGVDLTPLEISVLIETLVEESSVPEAAHNLGMGQVKVAETKERALKKIRKAFNANQKAA